MCILCLKKTTYRVALNFIISLFFQNMSQNKVRLIIAQGPNQLLYVLSALCYQKASGEYQNCEDILILGGYRPDPKLTEVCLQISEIWDFKDRILLHGFQFFCTDNSLDFVSTVELLKRTININCVDVIYTLRNWQFINEIFLYAYPNSRKICYGEVGWLEVSSKYWSNLYNSPPLNPSGDFIPMDDAYLPFVPVDGENALEKCPVRLVEADFFSSVVCDSARNIPKLNEYCAEIINQLGNSITIVLTSYDTEAGYTKSYEDEIACYLSCALAHTQAEEAIIVKGHPRQAYNQSQLLAEKLCEHGRKAFVISDLNHVPIEFFVPFLPITKVVAPMSSACITLGELGDYELIIGLGENLIRKYISPKYQEPILIMEYIRILQVKYSRQPEFEPIKYLEIKQNTQEYPQYPTRINLSVQNTIPQIPIGEFIDNYDLTDKIFRVTEQYKIEPSKLFLLEELSHFRKQMAEYLLSVEPNQIEKVYASKIGEGYRVLVKSGIQNQNLTESEQLFVNEIIGQVAEGFNQPKAIQHILAAMLYSRADELPLEHDFSFIPNWLLHDYLQLLFSSPIHFHKSEEANNYYGYMQGWVNYFYTSIFNKNSLPIPQGIVNYFAQCANFIPTYFNEENLKELYVKRAAIIEHFLKNNGCQVNYEFPERPVNRKKIRVGILAAHFMPGSETFAYLPVYEYLSREFEVILYSLNQTGHPLEQYCQSCANYFKLLPQDLTTQVNAIRADDLDILFVATNVTAITNQICLLVTHRLARNQVTSGGSLVTTGMQHIDYYVSGTLTEPSPIAQEQYREELIKLEGTAHCFSYGCDEAKSTIKVDRESLGIAEDSVIFISGANFFKITFELIHTWVTILLEVPNSVLVLLPYGPNWSNSYPKKVFENNLNEVLSEYGLSKDRLIILDPQPVPNREDVKEYYKIADVYLDSYPFAGTTSLVEPLQVTLPVIARQGNSFRSAMGAAMIRSLDVSDLVADSEESYIKIAVALGINPELRQQKRAEIKAKMQNNPAFLDSRSYSAKIGNLFQKLFNNYQITAMNEKLSLRDNNFIIFPDWNQSEESIGSELQGVIKTFATHRVRNTTTLLIDTSNITAEDAEMFLSSVAMNLMMAEDIDITEDLQISLVGELSHNQWKALLASIQGRIVLECENKEAVAQLPVEILQREIDNFQLSVV